MGMNVVHTILSMTGFKLLNQNVTINSKTGVKQSPSKRPKIGFQDQLLLNAGQKYC